MRRWSYSVTTKMTDSSTSAATLPTGDLTAAELESDYCPLFQQAVELIGRRWTGAILKALGAQPLRFTEIRSAIPGLSDRLLNARLSELEDEGVVQRCATSGEVRYWLSEKGRALEPVFEAIAAWSHRFAEGDPDASPGRIRS